MASHPHAHDYSTDELYILTYFLISVIIMSIIVVILSLFLMKNLGLGKDTKSKILWRHVSLLLAFSICNIFIVFIYGYQVSHSMRAEGLENKWYVKIMQAFFYSQGFILSVIRMMEPGSF